MLQDNDQSSSFLEIVLRQSSKGVCTAFMKESLNATFLSHHLENGHSFFFGQDNAQHFVRRRCCTFKHISTLNISLVSSIRWFMTPLHLHINCWKAAGVDDVAKAQVVEVFYVGTKKNSREMLRALSAQIKVSANVSSISSFLGSEQSRARARSIGRIVWSKL